MICSRGLLRTADIAKSNDVTRIDVDEHGKGKK